MKFYDQDKKLLIQTICTTFNSKKNQATFFINLLEKAVFENDKEIFYYLKYIIHGSSKL